MDDFILAPAIMFLITTGLYIHFMRSMIINVKDLYDKIEELEDRVREIDV